MRRAHQQWALSKVLELSRRLNKMLSFIIYSDCRVDTIAYPVDLSGSKCRVQSQPFQLPWLSKKACWLGPQLGLLVDVVKGWMV